VEGENMKVTYQDPVLTEQSKLHGDTYEHPAFGQIGASRVSGRAHLYGSDFEHQHYVTVSISGSRLVRNLSNEWHFAGKELIEVALSEAQWATFVSSMNVGSGVPCTLQHVAGYATPQLAPPKKPSEKFSEDMEQTMAELREELTTLADALTDGNVGKTKAKEIQKKLRWLSERLTNNTEFVANQFDEHMEKTVEKAKVEVNAYVTGMVQRAGLDALGVTHKPVVALEWKPDDECPDCGDSLSTPEEVCVNCHPSAIS
jgi:hypothetical protein